MCGRRRMGIERCRKYRVTPDHSMHQAERLFGISTREATRSSTSECQRYTQMQNVSSILLCTVVISGPRNGGATVTPQEVSLLDVPCDLSWI